MRKIGLVLFCAFVLVFGVTMSASAEDVNARIYFDTWRGANLNTDGDYDIKSSFFGCEIAKDRYKFVAEFGTDDAVKGLGGVDYELDILNINFGYLVLDIDQLKVDAIAGYSKIDYQILDCAGIMVGIDLDYLLSENIFVQGSVAFSFTADLEDEYRDDYSSESMYIYNWKVGLIMNENLALTAGYRAYTIDYNKTVKIDGLTLGVMCSF
jgi:hypothetical protein